MRTNHENQVKMRKAAEKARKRRSHMKELSACGAGGSLVLAGLILAVLYCLVTHNITV
jgi:hypothetical protein